MEWVIEGNGSRTVLGRRTLVMGIVNVTPDSFFDGGRYSSAEMAVEHGLHLVEQGADILDIGGESTRPGASPVSLSEELERTIPVIKALARQVTIPISIDTVKAEVARAAIDAGAHWVNDISAGLMDPAILDVVAAAQVPYVAMHMRGTPQTMQQDTSYSDLIGEMNLYFEDRLRQFETNGLERGRILLDPGIGFGKSAEQNYYLLGHLEQFRPLGCPLLVGPSRKSFLKLVGALDTESRLPGTLAAVTACVLAGVEVVRVHDVAEVVQAVRVAERIRAAGKPVGWEG